MKVCPNGWHLPSEAEWNILSVAVGGYGTEAKYLKATSGWECKYCNGEDKFGFSALPGGYGNLEDINYGNGDKKYLLSVRCIQDTTYQKKFRQ